MVIAGIADPDPDFGTGFGFCSRSNTAIPNLLFSMYEVKSKTNRTGQIVQKQFNLQKDMFCNFY
jgi:hypothetical protein